MNSGALVKVEMRESWMERLLGARGARLLLIAAGTIAVTLSVPAAQIEDIATATGLSDMTGLFAPPIGLGARLLVGIVLALVPAGIFWALWGSPPPIQSEPSYEAEFLEIEDEDEMMNLARNQSSASAWGALIRLVRGGLPDNTAARDEVLSRRRRDRHPDAPPRPPLFASRDLPPHDESVIDLGTAPVEPDVIAPTSSKRTSAPESVPSRVAVPTSDHDDVAQVIAAMPRSPAPMSDDQIATVMAAMSSRKAEPPKAGLDRQSSADLLHALDLPLIENADLGTLAARFEHGISRREVIAHAAEAQQSLDSSISLVQTDPSVRAALRAQRPIGVAPSVGTAFDPVNEPVAGEPALRVDADVEQALNSALATLRKLTEQGRR